MDNSNKDKIEPGIPQQIAIAATFTAEPVEEALAFWMQELQLPSQIEFSPYNQVFQQLLDPSSLLNQNAQGVNVTLVRFEDWQRFEHHEAVEAAKSQETQSEIVSKNVEDFIVALKSASGRSATPYIICLCPASPAVADANQTAFQQLEELMVSQLSSIGGVYLMRAGDLAAYPVEDYYDPQGDKLGHIPFTPVFFTALGTRIARKIYAIKSAPHKVIVLDCDNTLWKGIVGEDGVMGIEMSPPFKALQEFMVAQQRTGMLICLCSKNNEADVVEVFEQRPEIPLKREHIVSWRINWLPKSENIKSLSTELNLGLDSFIFLDDNPVECGEVQTSCPEVLTLQLPEERDITRFLQHVWAFDRLKVTKEDKQRTALYKQNLERDNYAKASLTIDDFLAGLDLRVNISEMAPSQMARVSQLTQRTNQFNFTTIRRSESEIQQLAQSGWECRVVEVSDRFGDYGLVGVVIFGNAADAINIDTFLLSCRVLGRGVEHRILAHLAEIAKERGLSHITAAYIPTKKNQPALNFLDSVGADFKQSHDSGDQYSWPVEFAAAISYKTQDTETVSQSNVAVTVATASVTAPTQKSARLNRIANELHEPETILQLIESQQRQQKLPTADSILHVAPRTETEKVLAAIWANVLRVEQVGIHDDFFQQGGSSLLAVSLFAQIQKTFGKNLPLTTLIAAPTIEQLANTIDAEELSAIESVIPLQSSGDKPPLFCIYGILLYQDLARNLSSDQPVYGVYVQEEVELLQGGRLEAQQSVLTSVPDLAALYLREIRKFRPTGPYFLAGESFGGLVAFEMAQQLHLQGEKVGLVVLFDTDAPGSLQQLPWTERAALHIRHFFQKGPRYALEKLGGRLESSKEKLVSSISKIYGGKSPDRSLPDYLQEAAIRDIRQQVRDQAISNYVPQPYTGKMMLFRAMDRSGFEAYDADTQWGWKPVAAGGLEVHHVPGDHIGIIKEPHVQIVAANLTACLDKVQAEL